jgi:hypothetical protein
MSISETSQSRLAVLIDADNAQPSITEGLLSEVAKYGVASVKRIYGDWTTSNLNGWKDFLLKYSIQPVQQFRYTVGKMQRQRNDNRCHGLLCKRFDSSVVSSDSDFTRLACRLEGLWCMDLVKAPKPFVSHVTNSSLLKFLG